MIILLDSGPLGLVTNPKVAPDARACANWLERIISTDHLPAIPEIVDYELRRELLRTRKTRALLTLDTLALRMLYLPISTPVMRQAAEFWAIARQRGVPTADDKALDADVILAAQARFIEETWQQKVVIATTNVRHLARFATAQEWQDIS